MKKYFYFLFVFILIMAISSYSCKNKKPTEPEVEAKTYQVMFFSDNDFLKEVEVEEGKSAESLAPTPSKEGFKFVGWDQDITKVEDDLLVYAVFEVASYKVSFFDGENLLKEEMVEYQKSATAPIISNQEEGYEYSWDKRFNSVTSDLIVKLVKKIKTFSVILYDQNGDIYSSTSVEYGASITTTLPNYESEDGLEVYEFSGWDIDLSFIDSDVRAYPEFKKIKASIKYSFNGIFYDLSPNSYVVGSEVDLPELSLDGYIFNGWYLADLSFVRIDKIDKDMQENYILYAKMTETVPHKAINIGDADYYFTEIIKRPFSSGSSLYVIQPVMPEGIPNSSVTAWTFSTTDPKIATVSEFSSITVNSVGYTIIQANLKADPNIRIRGLMYCDTTGARIATETEAASIQLCTVEFLDKNDNVIDTQTIIKGTSPIIPTPIEYEGFYFAGWDKKVWGIEEDTVFKPIYKAGEKTSYVGKTFAIIGDSITTFRGYIPDGFSCFYPYPTGDVFDVNQTWWKKVINDVGGTLLINNAYSGSCVDGGGSSASKNIGRLKYTYLYDVKPDVILILMGANDAHSLSTATPTFERAYDQMLDNLAALCPDSEIICITLPISNLYSEGAQKGLNTNIYASAIKHNAKVVDLEELSIIPYLLDSAHPLASGQAAMAEEIIKQLREL